jgi:hypothetical protein
LLIVSRRLDHSSPATTYEMPYLRGRITRSMENNQQQRTALHTLRRLRRPSVTPKEDQRTMNTANNREQAAIEHHIHEAHKAAQLASTYLAEAGSPREGEVTVEQWLAIRYFTATLATAAAQVADTHTRLLELKLAVGGPAL